MDIHTEDSKAEAVEYIVLLEQLGIDDRDTSGHKDRAQRRFKFDSPEKTMRLQIGDDLCTLYDVSVGGLSFKSKNEYEVGKKLELNFDGRFNVNVVIVNAHLDKTASNDEETFFRHGAEFDLDCDAYKCTIAVLKYFVEIEKGQL